MPTPETMLKRVCEDVAFNVSQAGRPALVTLLEVLKDETNPKESIEKAIRFLES